MNLNDLCAIVPPGVAEEIKNHIAERDATIAQYDAGIQTLSARAVRAESALMASVLLGLGKPVFFNLLGALFKEDATISNIDVCVAVVQIKNGTALPGDPLVEKIIAVLGPPAAPPTPVEQIEPPAAPPTPAQA